MPPLRFALALLALALPAMAHAETYRCTAAGSPDQIIRADEGSLSRQVDGNWIADCPTQDEYAVCTVEPGLVRFYAIDPGGMYLFEFRKEALAFRRKVNDDYEDTDVTFACAETTSD